MAKFLEEGHKVKITIMFRGREVFHPELGKKILDRIADQMDGMGKSEAVPRLDGRNMVMVLAPDKRAKQSAASEGPGPRRATAPSASGPGAADRRRQSTDGSGGEARGQRHRADRQPAAHSSSQQTAGGTRRHRPAVPPVAAAPAEAAGDAIPGRRVERRRGLTRCRR